MRSAARLKEFCHPDFFIFYGLITLLSNLKKPARLLLINNEAIAEDSAAHNVTLAEFEENPFFVAALEYHIIPAFLVSLPLNSHCCWFPLIGTTAMGLHSSLENATLPMPSINIAQLYHVPLQLTVFNNIESISSELRLCGEREF